MMIPKHPICNTATHARRGMAMLLVIISLTFATIVAVAYLASRDNSALIGQNISSGAQSRWAAESALDTVEAMLQTESNWRTAHVDGVLLADLAIGDALVDVHVADLYTSEPPTATTEFVRVIAYATAGGVQQTASFTAYVENFADDSYDADLSEFVVFVSDSLAVGDTATIARWETSPRSRLKERVNIGTRAVDAGSLAFGADTTLIDLMAYSGPTASGLLVSNDATFPVDATALTNDMPMPLEPETGAVRVMDGSSMTANLYGFDVSMYADAHYRAMNLGASASFRLRQDLTIILDEDLTLSDDARLYVSENVTLIVFGDVALTDAAIELVGDATLTMFVGGDITLSHAYIGDRLPTEQSIDVYDLDASSRAGYIDPQRIRIFGLQGDEVAQAGGTATLSAALASNTVAYVSYTGSALSATGLEFASAGRLKDADDTDLATVWRLRNANDTSRDVVLRDPNSTFSVSLTIPADSDLFVRSPVVTGPGDVVEHEMITEHGTLTATATDTTFVDSRTAIIGHGVSDQPPQWSIDASSVVKGALYSTRADLTVADASAVFGCIAVRAVSINSDGAVYFSPTTNEYRGYTNPDSHIYSDGGTLIDAVLDADATLDATVKGVTKVVESGDLGDLGGALLGGGDEPGVTPRPVRVDILSRTYGHDMHEWEASRIGSDGSGSLAPQSLLDGIESLALYIGRLDADVMVSSGSDSAESKRETMQEVVQSAWSYAASTNYEAAMQRLEWTIERANATDADARDMVTSGAEQSHIETTATTLITQMKGLL